MQMMWYGKAPIVGPLFPPYVLSVYAPIVFGLIILIKHGRQSRVIDERIRNQYIMAGIIAMFIGKYRLKQLPATVSPEDI